MPKSAGFSIQQLSSPLHRLGRSQRANANRVFELHRYADNWTDGRGRMIPECTGDNPFRSSSYPALASWVTCAPAARKIGSFPSSSSMQSQKAPRNFETGWFTIIHNLSEYEVGSCFVGCVTYNVDSNLSGRQEDVTWNTLPLCADLPHHPIRVPRGLMVMVVCLAIYAPNGPLPPPPSVSHTPL